MLRYYTEKHTLNQSIFMPEPSVFGIILIHRSKLSDYDDLSPKVPSSYILLLNMLRYDTEKHYLFILKLTRHGIKDPVYVFRTYK